ncbi:Protein transport protein Sec31A [Nymphon striatum]|nr:Protein transport protein Sec31A [Nymphon striatum]
MKVKEVDRTANIAWSPAAQHPIYLAAGTAAQQLDATFSTTAALEIYGLNLTEPGLDMSLKGSIVSEHRFHNIAWGCHEVTSSDKDTTGVIVGGADDGNLIVYDPSKILQGNKGIIFQKNNHNGPVRTLDFNPHKPNLLASGSSESEIFIWDLLHPVKPMTPGTKSQPLEDVACVAWNCQVQHILASTFPGKCVVWDLRKNEPIIKVSDTSYRMRCKEIAWHPAVATQLCIASEDDQTPVIQLWDLRFATSPLKVLENHQRGVLSLAWCKQDPDLLISCGKDSRILCWNPNSNVPGGEVVCEINSNQWNFSVAWCERNPAVIASSSFDGYVGIYSLMGGQQQLTPSSKITDAFPGSETLSQPPVNQLPQRNVALPLKKPPKWLRKPVGASFANIFKIDLLESKFTITEFVGLLVMYIRNTSTALLDQTPTQNIIHYELSPSDPLLDQEISEDEIISALAESRGSSSPGLDGISYTFLKNNQQLLTPVLSKLFNDCFQMKLLPPQWNVSKIVMIFKKGNFGGKLVQFSDKQENKVTITQVATDESTMQRSSHLENSLTSRNFADFCTKKLELSPNEYDRTIWSFLLANFEDNPRQKALKLLGYNAEELSKKIQEVLKVEFLNSGVDAEELANRMSTLSAGPLSNSQQSTPSFVGSQTPENSRDVSRDAFDAIGESKSIDGLISRAILVGNIDYAVSLCLQDGRMADALVLAMAGGADLWQQTQQRYLKNSKSDVAKLIAAVVTDSWKQLVVNCDIMYWKEALSAILTYGKQNEFCELCEILGKRLENEKSGELFNKASICYICSGNLEHFVACYSKKNTDENSVQLQDLMEKVMILEKAVEVTQIRPIESIRNGPLLSDKLSGYAKLLANQGQLLSAFSYLSNCNTEEANILKDRIYKSISDYLPGVQPPSFPYRRISLQPSVEPRQAPHIQKNVPRQTNQWSMNKAPTTNNYYGGANQPISEQFMPPHLNNTISSGLYGPPSTSMPNSVPHNVAQSIPSVPPTSISQNLITNSATGPPGPPPPSSSTLPNQKGHMSHRYPSTPQDPSLYSQGYSSVNQANYMSFPQQQNFMQPNAISNSVQNSTSGAMVPNAAHSQPTSNLYNPYMSSPASDTSQFSQVAPPPVSAPYGTSRTDFNLGWNDPPVLTSNVQLLILLLPITQPIFNPNQPQQPIFNPNQPQDIPNAPVTNQYQNNFAVAPSPMSQLNYGGQNYNAPPQQMQNDQQFIENTEPPLPAAPIEPIPEKHAVIMDVLIALTAKCSNATTNPQMRRKLEDVSRKLENLENKLRYNALSETTLNYLHEMVSHIKCEDYQSAIAVTTNCITRVNFSEISSFMPGIKVLLQVGLQLGIYYSD